MNGYSGAQSDQQPRGRGSGRLQTDTALGGDNLTKGNATANQYRQRHRVINARVDNNIQRTIRRHARSLAESLRGHPINGYRLPIADRSSPSVGGAPRGDEYGPSD